MKNKIRKLFAGFYITVFIFSSVSPLYAGSFNDVDENNTAYLAIESIAAQGIMSGDPNNNFNPDKYIDKFDTSKMFAYLLGYKTENATAEEKAYFDKAYNDNKDLISTYSSKFQKWNSSADKEVAYLLAKGFYTKDDLEQFVIIGNTGTEQLRALSKEEMAVFLARYAGKTSEASAYSESTKFADDNVIADNKKSYTYYLKAQGIMTADANNKFGPKTAVTRAGFCVFLNNAMTKWGVGILTAVNTSAPPAAVNNSALPAAVSNTGSSSCTIEKYFPSMSIMQVYENGQHRLYKVLPSASIKINGALGNVTDVPVSSSATITLVNGEITAIDAQAAVSSVSQSPTASDEVKPSSVSANTADVSAHIPNDNELTIITGTVDSVSENSVTISYKMIASDGTTVSQSKSYDLASGCTVTKNNSSAEISDITKDCSAEIGIYGTEIYKIKISETSTSQSKETNTIDGYVTSINITDSKATLGVSETEKSNGTVYKADTDAVPVYALKLGDKVRIHLRDGIIRALSIKKTYDDYSVYGIITSKKSDYIVVEYYDGDDLKSKRISYDDEDTNIISGVSGKSLKFSELDEDMKVYVILCDDGKTAENIALIVNA